MVIIPSCDFTYLYFLTFRIAIFLRFFNVRLAVLFLQKVEAQEREDDNIGKGVKMVKGKVGKPKAKKLNLEETLPSLYGRRVEPPTQALRSDSAKKLSRKKKVTTAAVILENTDEESRGVTACVPPSQVDDSSVKMEFDEDGLGVEAGVAGAAGAAGAAENAAVVPKPKTPRVRKDKKEPGQYYCKN